MVWIDNNYRNDAWKDTYDAWKLASPYDCYDEPECIHEEFDEDVEGRFVCVDCDHRWFPTPEERERQRRRRREHEKWERQQRRRERWHNLTDWIRWSLYRLLERVWPRRKNYWPLDADEIPF